ncbi:hypothetical protein GGR16_002006 [Chelatococcus caeni]|uniref:Uncharacterized protein n=1 Tax=Chelatococcus caeni TaxID=1348468 RepID=A0A840C3H2_9HYPH|nr:UPF0280 family protein [Chelatococcus caeni]MBB4016977.1 hypothetical protein [Chelatococcus caeni]
MRDAATARMLPDGRRLHLQHGPIDLIIEAFGEAGEVARAYEAAARRFATLLDELCAELPALRRQARPGDPPLAGAVARRMQGAVMPHAADGFITPMAAVAGADADEVLAAMLAVARLDKAYVNNGGDIALHLSAASTFSIGMVDRPDEPGLFGTLSLTAAHGIGGIATSGRHGRSFSLGIADAVTVLARDAAAADAAATMIANAVDLPGHPAVTRVPASVLAPESDLGERPVTRAVRRLDDIDIAAALDAGCGFAQALLHRGLIIAAALHLQGHTRTVGSLPAAPTVAAPAPRPADTFRETGQIHA